MIIACIVAFACLGDGRWGRFAAVLMEGVTLIVILRASHARPRTMRIVGGFVLVALLVVALAATSDGKFSRAAPVVLGAALALGAPIAIVRRLRDQAEINFMTVAGALCIYLLAGLFFALLYWSNGVIAHGPFFAQRDMAGAVDYVYFSFVTLTTVGYGDLTARQDPGRMFSILEALFGQLYLVSVVALLVANIGRSRPTRPG
jgi:drug/metabolite transporter (DMT)-like permease